MEPVPASTMTPGPSPKAASMAITMSPTTSICPPATAPTRRRTVTLTSGTEAPATPTQTAATWEGRTWAAAHAWRMAASRLRPACSSPRRTRLLPPLVAVASRELSSPTAQVVLLPPPSMPRKKAMDADAAAAAAPPYFYHTRTNAVTPLFPPRCALFSDNDALVASTCHGPEPARSDHYHRLSGGHHAVRAALPQAAAFPARLFPGRPQRALVGHLSLHRGGGDQHAHHHQHSRPGL